MKYLVSASINGIPAETEINCYCLLDAESWGPIALRRKYWVSRRDIGGVKIEKT